MTEKQRLEEMRTRLITTEANNYDRMKKENVLEDLIASTHKETGKISFPLIIPIYEHNIDFLKGILYGLGYKPNYEKEYNYFFSTTCYKVSLNA